MERLRKWINLYVTELTEKVTWPTVAELQSMTVTVLVASILLAIVIALMDIVFRFGMGFLYELV